MDPNTLRLMQGSAGAGAKLYVEDVFSTWLYTGNSSTQTITNGVDLAGKGGLVWTKGRGAFNENHAFVDTVRGTNKYLASNNTDAEGTGTQLTAFNSNGYTLGAVNGWEGNWNGRNYASWTFRKQAKFFDVVTWTGDGTSNRQIAHNLGSVPGCIIVKNTGFSSNWIVYHRSLTNNQYVRLNTIDSVLTSATMWNATDPTSVNFTVGSNSETNANGYTFVAYLFAHDAGGFGASGSDSVIKCGSYTGNGSSNGPQVDLSWEPQWLMLKRTSNTASWYIYDNMRGVATGGIDSNLRPDSNSAEDKSFDYLDFNSTGFKLTTSSSDHNASGNTYIYIAIRRGPMKTPTDATNVFYADTGTNSTGATVTTSFPVDLMIQQYRDVATNHFVYDRLRSLSSTTTEDGLALFTSATAAESVDANQRNWSNTGYQVPSAFSASSRIFWNFRRAPGFFDVVAYTGTGASQSLTHNLSAAPELIIVKARSTTSQWRVGAVFASTTYATGDLNNDTSWTTGVSYGSNWFSAQPTSTTFGVTSSISASSTTYIAYLFASCSGVSKVGSYTGTGTTLSIDCGFTAGARFVLIKRTDSTGDWYVWDSARGIVSGDDPYLLLNNTNAEVTGTDYVDPYSPGFEISSTAPAAINANGGSFIFLAVA